MCGVVVYLLSVFLPVLSWLLSLYWQEVVVTLVDVYLATMFHSAQRYQKLDWELLNVCYSVGCRT